MTQQKRPYPGGYKIKERLTDGICVCCQGNPIAKGNRKLCLWCYTDPYDREGRVEPVKITEEDACELAVKVAIMEQTPPTPVRQWTSAEYSQEELQAILNGGGS